MLLDTRLDPKNIVIKTIEAIESAISAVGYKIYLDDIQEKHYGKESEEESIKIQYSQLIKKNENTNMG